MRPGIEQGLLCRFRSNLVLLRQVNLPQIGIKTRLFQLFVQQCSKSLNSLIGFFFGYCNFRSQVVRLFSVFVSASEFFQFFSRAFYIPASQLQVRELESCRNEMRVALPGPYKLVISSPVIRASKQRHRKFIMRVR